MKNPAKPPKAVTTSDAGQIRLTPAELRLLGSFRTMDDCRQKNMVVVMQGLARDFPRRISPALRLVVGGAA